MRFAILSGIYSGFAANCLIRLFRYYQFPDLLSGALAVAIVVLLSLAASAWRYR